MLSLRSLAAHLALIVLLACCAPPGALAPTRPAPPDGPRARGGVVASSSPAPLSALPARTPRSSAPKGVALVAQLQHTKNIVSVVFSPDGTLALTTGDASIKLWDTSTLTVLRTLKGHSATVGSVVFLPDGRRALSASEDHTLKLWDTTTGAELRTYAHARWITSLALSADGHRAVAGDLDGKVKLWDVEAGTELRSLAAHPEGGTRVALSPDGQTLASTGQDNVIKLWDLRTGKLLRSLTGEPSAKPVLAFSTEGRTLSASRATGRLERVVALAFSPDGNRLLSATSSDVTLWDVPKGARVRRIAAEHTLALAFFKSGKRALVASADRGVSEWDTETGARLRAFATAKDEAFVSVALSPDERRVLTGSSPRDAGETLRLWNAASGEMLVAKSNGEASVWSAAFSPDGRRAVSACGDRSLRVWDTHAARLERTIRAEDLSPISVAVSPDNRHILSGGWDRNLRSWNIDTGAPAVDYLGEGDDIISIDAVAFSPDGRRVVAAIGYELKIWDAAGGSPLRTLAGHTDDVHAVAFLPDSKRLVSASQDGTLKLWEVETGALLHTFGDEGANFSFFAVAAAPDGHRVAGAGRKGNIYVWDVDKPGDAPSVIEGAHASIIDTVAFSPDGKRILSGAEDYTMKLWDAATRKPERTFAGHENQINTVAFSPDGLYALSSSYDEATRLWRLDDGYSMAMVARDSDWLAYTSDGYFDASRRGGDLVAAVQNNRAFRIDQLALTNNRPDQMMQGMGFADEAIATYYRSRFERRVKKLGLSADRLSTTFDKAPEARIVATKVEKSFADITFELSDPDGRLFRYNLFVNDVPILGMLGKAVSGAKQQMTERVELGAGPNKIEVGVLNESGAEALRPFRLIDEKDKSKKGDLYFLGFGVSHYKNPKYDLAYPHKDVLDLAEVLRTKNDSFREVHLSTYVNEEATVANVRKAKDFLRPATVDDTVVLFVAGHGLHSSTAAAEYYYATYEVDPKHLPETAANFELIEELLQGIAPRKKLFLMDTCESGEREEGEVTGEAGGAGQRGLRARSARALVLDEAPVAAAPKPRSRFVYDRERYIENDLARRSGAIVLSSSRGSELSYELEELQNGAFTEAILAALTSSVADKDNDGAVSTDELRVYVAKEVARLTKDQQHPTVDRDNLDMKFGLPVIAAAHAVQTRADPLALVTRTVASHRGGAIAAEPARAPALRTAPVPHACGCRLSARGDSTAGSVVGVGLAALLGWRRRRARRTSRLPPHTARVPGTTGASRKDASAA